MLISPSPSPSFPTPCHAQRMKQGPKRDRERLEATTARLYEQALEQWKDEQGSSAQQDQQPSRA